MAFHFTFVHEMTGRLFLALALAALAARRHDLLTSRRVTLAAWLIALAYFAHGFVTTPVKDDETYYLAAGYEASQGSPNGELPMRQIVYLPIVLPPLEPSGTIALDRLVTFFAGLVCAWSVHRVAARLGSPVPGLAAALTLIWLRGDAEWSFARPEYFASFFLMSALPFLFAPPAGWSRARSAIVAFVFLGWMAGTSHRHCVVLPFAVLSLWLASEESPRRVAVWVAAGLTLSLVPSLVYVWFVPVLQKIVGYHRFFAANGVPPLELGAKVPVLALASILAAIRFLWQRRAAAPAEGALAVLLAGVLVGAIVSPQKFPHTVSSFLCLCGLAAGCLAPMLSRPLFTGLLALAMLLPLLHHNRGLFLSRADFHQRTSELANHLKLLDFLHTAAGPYPVMCVAPYQPLRVTNAWQLYNAYYYCFYAKTLGRELMPGLPAVLLSGRSSLIQWDAWPSVAGRKDLLDWATGYGLLPADALPQVKQVLRERYRLVRWPGPLPSIFGGARFLVRRDRPFAGAIEEPNPALD